MGCWIFTWRIEGKLVGISDGTKVGKLVTTVGKSVGYFDRLFVGSI